MTAAWVEELRVFADTGGQPQTGNRIEGAVTSSRPLFAASQSPVLCHNDVHEANTLAIKRRDTMARHRCDRRRRRHCW